MLAKPRLHEQLRHLRVRRVFAEAVRELQAGEARYLAVLFRDDRMLDAPTLHKSRAHLARCRLEAGGLRQQSCECRAVAVLGGAHRDHGVVVTMVAALIGSARRAKHAA